MFLLGAAHGWGAKRPSFTKICQIYSTIMKLGTVILYLKKIQKTYKSRDTPLEGLLTSAIVHQKSETCYIKKYGYGLHFNT